MIQNKKVLILGMARSGVAVAKLLLDYQNEILITDMKEQEKSLVLELESSGIQVMITDHQQDLVEKSIDVVIKNPAISKNHPAVLKAKELSIPVMNEMEASYFLLPKDVTIIGITGSNGKTTTTTILYELLKRSGKKVWLGGNIGIPLSSFAKKVQSGDLLVLEISDHQLCDMYDFKTNISILTNLFPTHLDFHGDYETYLDMKKRIFQHHSNNDFAILNKENADVLKLSQDIFSSKVYFSSKSKADIFLKEGKIYFGDEEILSCEDIRIKGNHNYENIMATLWVAKHFGVENEEIKAFLKEFPGVEHRIEFVRELHGRKFYNDSKATNNEATRIALDSFQEETLLLMGGLDRGIPFDELSSHLSSVKKIYCYGQTKEKIKEFALLNHKEVETFLSLEDATRRAYEESLDGDIILLSPACASWDQFKDFEVRGDTFKKIVWSLK